MLLEKRGFIPEGMLDGLPMKGNKDVDRRTGTDRHRDGKAKRKRIRNLRGGNSEKSKTVFLGNNRRESKN